MIEAPDAHAPIRPRRADLLIAAVLCLIATVALQLASRTQGYARDEGYYFQAAEQHVAYLEESILAVAHGKPLTFADRHFIDRYLGYNSEHPPLMKTLFGISWRLLHRCNCPNEAGLHPLVYSRRHITLGLLSQGAAMRLPAHLLTGLLVAGVFLFGVMCFGRTAGLLGAALTLLQPRLFFHSQISCFDAPVAAMIFLITLAYLRLVLFPPRRTWRSGILFGVLLALGLLTKHNTFFLVPVLWLHWLFQGRAGWSQLASLSAAEKWRAIADLLLAPWMRVAAVVTPIAYFVGWPHLWPAPIARFSAYVGFHLHHVHYNIEYLGTNYNRPPYPWHYVPLMTALTAPVTTLFLAAIGIFALRKSRHAAIVALGILWPMLVIMRPGTPIFGAEKHWLPAMPFVALVGGLGFARVIERIETDLLRRAMPVVGVVLGIFVAMPALFDTVRSHPYGLSHYNALAGGPQGGADLGMNRQFWGYAVRGLMPTIDRVAPPHAPIYFHDANWPMLQMSMKDGFLRRDLRDSGIEEPGVRASRLGMVILEKHFNKYEYWHWDAFGTTQPIEVLTHEGVPIVTLYARP